MLLVILICSFCFGALIGSFLNVCIHRLPRNESVVSPPSRCYACGSKVMWYDNLPIISWLLLRGRCRQCGSSFSIRYMLGEIAVAALTVMVVLVSCKYMPTMPVHFLQVAGFGWQWYAAAATAMGLCLAYYLWVASVIDIDHTIIPDELTKPAQALFPFLATLSPVGLFLPGVPYTWFTKPTMYDSFRWEAWEGAYITAGLAALVLLVLLLSLPLSRFIYGRYCPEAERWREEDFHGFSVGVRFFVAVTAVQLVVLLIVGGLVGTATGANVAAAWCVQFAQAILGSLTGWCVLYFIGFGGTMLFKRNAMGYGDVKYLAPIGAVLGPAGVGLTFFLAALAACIVGLPHRLMTGNRHIPFGPFLAIGAIITLLWGQPVWDFLMSLASFGQEPASVN